MVPYVTITSLRNFYYSGQHKHFMYLRILSLWTWWDPNMHSIYGLSYQKAWRWPVCSSKHVASNKTTIKSVVPDVPLFYFISNEWVNFIITQIFGNLHTKTLHTFQAGHRPSDHYITHFYEICFNIILPPQPQIKKLNKFLLRLPSESQYILTALV